MLKMYQTDLATGVFSETKEFNRGTWINLVNPSEKEIDLVCENLKISSDFIRYPLDYEEKARIDIEDDMTLFVIDVPYTEKVKEEKIYTTMPLGMITVRDDYFITVSLNKASILEDFEKGKVKNFFTYKKTRFILQILYANSSAFLNNLKQINKETEIAEYVLQRSMKNKELIKLLNLEKSLVYITTSLRSNELVMEKL